MGRSMLGGRVLYRDVFDHKGPVLYLLYGLAGLVGGTDFRGTLPPSMERPIVKKMFASIQSLKA
jgi:hypothetical protein